MHARWASSWSIHAHAILVERAERQEVGSSRRMATMEEQEEEVDKEKEAFKWQ